MTPRELLVTGAQELGIELSAEQTDAFVTYLAELNKWNKKMNLTAIRDERDAIIKHVLDSLSYSKGLVPQAGMRLLDIGSGAGFPAVPIKIAYPAITVTLVESTKKKASFLRHIVRALKLYAVDVVDKRVEELSEPLLGAYDVVTARAFAEMKSAIKAGRPFLKKRGFLILSRGPEESLTHEELAGTGMALEKRIALTLPHSEYRRTIWVFTRTLD